MITKKTAMGIMLTVLFTCAVLSGCKENADGGSTGEATESTGEATESTSEDTESTGEDTKDTSGDTIGSVAPCGMLFGSPLYIGYASDFGDALDGKASVAESYSDDTGEDKIWVYSPGGIPEAAIIPVSCSDGEWLAHGQRLAMPLKSDEILEFITGIPTDSDPNEAIVCYSEDMETQYAYAIGLDDKTGAVNAFLIEITGVGEAWY